MTRVHIFCEGQTEETFVRDVLQDHFNRLGIFLSPIVIRTSNSARGGVTSYAKLRWQIDLKCKEDSSAFVTSLIDFYGLPSDFPEKEKIDGQIDPYQKVQSAENAFAKNINHRNFIQNIVLHEFEALLFSDMSKFVKWFLTSASAIEKLSAEIQGCVSPEHVNDNPNSAPSKRILRHCLSYEKPYHGSLIAIDIGLDVIRNKCQHFNAWLTKIEKLAAAQ